MSTTAEPRINTPADLLTLPDRDLYELVDGHLVEQNVSALSSLVAVKLSRVLGNHCEPGNVAWIFGADCLYQCFPGHPHKVRKPDVSVIRQERLAAEHLAEGFVTIAPDVAVEVISPNDLACEVETKVQDYLEAGVRLVWVVYPLARTVHIRRGDGSSAILNADDELTGEDVLPGSTCRVGTLFPPLSQAAPTA